MGAILLKICFVLMSIFVLWRFSLVMFEIITLGTEKEMEKQDKGQRPSRTTNRMYRKFNKVMGIYKEEFNQINPLFYSALKNITSIEHIVTRLDMYYEKSILEDIVTVFENLFNGYMELDVKEYKKEIDKALYGTAEHLSDLTRLCVKEYERVYGTKLLSDNITSHMIMKDFNDNAEVTKELIVNRNKSLNFNADIEKTKYLMN